MSEVSHLHFFLFGLLHVPTKPLKILSKETYRRAPGRPPLAPRRKLVPSQCHDGPSRAKRTTCRPTLGFEEKTQATWHVVAPDRQGTIMVSKSTERDRMVHFLRIEAYLKR